MKKVENRNCFTGRIQLLFDIFLRLYCSTKSKKKENDTH